MAAETIIDIKAGMEYDNTPRCPLQPFLCFGVLPDCISLEFVPAFLSASANFCFTKPYNKGVQSFCCTPLLRN